MSESCFRQILRDSGYDLDGDNSPLLSVEPALFKRKLGVRLRSQPNASNTLGSFLSSLQNDTEDHLQLRRCLLPATLSSNVVTDSSRSARPESLFRLLLGVDILQPSIIITLLERLPEFYGELENDDSSSSTARLILHQLRWLDYVVEPENLTGKLIEIIEITPSIIQHEIITSLADIVNDSEHKPIVVYLKELMSSHSALTVPILDAFSNLTLHSESLEEVRETVLDRLASAELDDLAIILKFLLQTADTHSIDQVILGIREKLDFRALGRLDHDDRRINSSQRDRQTSTQSPVALVLESIKLGLQFHKFVCESWTRSINALETPSAHKVIDVIILFILHSMTSVKKKAEQIFRKKASNGLLTPSLLRSTLHYHANSLSGYWGSILSLAESLLRSSAQHSNVSSCASTLYVSSFKTCDAYYRQSTEINTALEVLLKLVENNTQEMSVYSVFIKGILDYLDNLDHSQIRILFDIFNTLALYSARQDGGDTSLWSDIQIVTRKQLSSVHRKYKRIGIIGSLSAIKILGTPNTKDERSEGSSTQGGASSSSSQVKRDPKVNQAIRLLEMVMRNCEDYSDCLAMVYDELAYILEHFPLDPHLQNWIKDNMTVDFTDRYIDSIDDTQERIASSSNPMKPAVCFNLDEEEGQITVKFYDILHHQDEKQRRLYTITLCSAFNLLQSCEKKQNDGSLEEVDALLGCGVILFDLEHIDDLLDDLAAQQLETACDIIFYTINWFRELLNAFSETSGEGIYQKLVQRLKNIIELETVLQKLQRKITWYTPLEVQISTAIKEGDDRSSIHIKRTEENSATRFSQASDISDMATEPCASMRKEAPKSNGPKCEPISDLRRLMRAMHVSVLCNLRTSRQDGSDLQKLSYAEINYLLKDLNEKLDIKFVPPAVTYFFGKKPTTEEKWMSSNAAMLTRMTSRELMAQVTTFLPDILKTLESLYGDLGQDQTQGGIIPEESEELVECIDHIFQSLNKLFSWVDLCHPDNETLLQDLIQSLYDRKATDSSKQPFLVMLKESIRYLAQFSEKVPRASTAVVLFKTILRLMELCNEENISDIRPNVGAVVTHILATDWYDWRDIKKEIQFLVEQAVELDEDPLRLLHEYVHDVLPTYEEEGLVDEYPLLRTDTVVSYCQAIMNQTVKSLRFFQDTDLDVDIVLVHNATVVKIFERITSFIKTKEHRILFGVLLKTSRMFIDQFTKYSIPYFTKIFRQRKDEIVAIFKDFQTSTRMLQIICSHVKVSKDVSLAAHVPYLKKTLEVVIYQVKMLLTENNAPSEAFFMGALKHRDIRGAEISSQILPEQTSDSEEVDQLPDESMDSAPERRPSPPTPRPKTKKNTPSTRKKRPAMQEIRTTSQVPSSEDESEEADADDNDNDSVAADIPPRNSLPAEQDNRDDENDSDALSFHFDSDEDSETDIPSKRPASPETTTPAPMLVVRESSMTDDEDKPKKRRLGVGRPGSSKRDKVFSLVKGDDPEPEE